MTKLDKLKQRFFRIPEPKDLTWAELCKVMKDFGFDWQCPSGGSHGFFIDGQKRMISPAVKPHGKSQNSIPIYQIRQYKEKLEDFGLLDSPDVVIESEEEMYETN